VHRDFKPENVLVGKDGRVRVTDFGLARTPGELAVGADAATGSVDKTLTRTGAFVGTPAYMAPEQMRGERVDALSDLFSFAATAWECLMGARPFLGESVEALRTAIEQGQLQRPPSTTVSPRLKRALERGLRAKPSERWPSIETLVVELGRTPLLRPSIGIAVAVALLLLAWAGHRALRAPVPSCKGAEEKLASVWDVARRQQLRRAFADAEARPLEAALDAYAHRFVSSWTDACEATRVRGEQSEQRLDLRMECLDERRRELDALVTAILAQPSNGAVAAAHRLTPASVCDEVSPSRRADPGRASPADRAAVEAHFMRASALIHLSSPHSAEEARALVDEAREKKVDELLSSALVLQGQALEGTDLKSAESALREAALAANVVHDDTALGHALIQLVDVVDNSNRFAEAERLAEYARRVVDGLGRPRSLTWRLEQSLADLAAFQDHLAEAEQHARRARELYERDHDTDPVILAQLDEQLALVLGDEGHFDEARRLRDHALGLLAGQLSSEAEETLILALEQAGDDDENGLTGRAIAGARQVVAAYQRRAPRFAANRASAEKELGHYLVDHGDLDEARRVLDEARATFESDNLKASILGDLGVIALRRGRAGEAESLLGEALRAHDALQPDETPARAEVELRLAQALGGGARSRELAAKGRSYLAAHPCGVRRQRLVAEADAWLAAHH
jgi:tetratricopeptide (TPR) repeat protein